MPDRPAVRRAEPADVDRVAELVYESAGGMFDLYAGSRKRALRVIRAAFHRDGNSTSREVVTVAESGGRVVGALAAFPVAELDERARRFLRITLRHTPPWQWPATLRVFRLGATLTPPPPADALYVDALAIDAAHRRRGTATRLLEAAGERAEHAGLGALALDTGLDNGSARALYAWAGFQVTGRRAAAHGLPGFMGLVRRPPR